MAASSEKLAVLNDHYKETNQIIERSVKTRDRYFFFMLVLLGVMAFQFFSPTQSSNLLTQVVKSKLDTQTALSINYISSLIWFSLLAVSIRYFQTVINLEKQYNYIHKLEEKLATEFDDEAFSREGKAYLQNYPLFSEWLHILYRGIFPLLLLGAVTIKIVSEWKLKEPAIIPLLLNTSIYVMLVVSTALYTFSLKAMHKDSDNNS